MSKHRLNSIDGEVICPNHIKINNTNLSPEEVADIVIQKFSLSNVKEQLNGKSR